MEQEEDILKRFVFTKDDVQGIEIENEKEE